MVKYIEKIQYAGEDVQYVGGDFFRGKWNFEEPLPLITSQTFNPGYYESYDLSEYIPNDGHDYEVMFSMRAHTGNTAANQCHWWVRSGSKDNYWLQSRIVGVRTNTASYETASATCIIPIKATDKAIGFYLETGSAATGSTYLTIHGYRKINNTNKDNELLLQQPFYFLFNNDNETYTFGGAITVGKWIVSPKLSVVTDVSISKDTVYTIDLSEHLPEDDTYTYECIIDGTVTTSSTTGEHTCFYIDIEDDDGNIASTEVASLYVRSGATKNNYFNTRVPVRANNRTIKVRNVGTSNITLNLRLEGYRRMGYYG